jgi:diguanylate cyclase (GGDEF)-like protein/PAS domain S-box-containing protein
MSESESSLARRVSTLERENRLLQIGLKQLTRIREQWTHSLDELKATKSRVEISRKFLDQLLHTAPLPVLVLSRPWSRIAMANMAAETLIGVSAGGLVGRRALGLVDRGWRGDFVQRFRSTEPDDGGVASEVCVATASGATRRLELHWAEVATLPGEPKRDILIAQDVTERQAAEQRLRLAGKIIESSPQGIAVLDVDNRILNINRAGSELSGHADDELIGQPAVNLVDAGRTKTFVNILAQIGDGLDQWQGELPFVRRNVGTYTAWVGILALRNPVGRVSHYILMYMDITERKKAEDRLRFHSLHDALTGLPNRVQYRDRLERAMISASRGAGRFGVMFLDLDGFKHVNDAYGHDAGDELLKQVASRLRGGLRANDTIARLGGDEFAAILLGIEEVGQLEKVARKILAAMNPEFPVRGQSCKVTVSIGISIFPDDAQDIDDLMKFADMAMYRVKDGGKNSYQFFTPDMNLEASRRMSMANRMERALEQGEFLTYYQPQIDIATRRIVGVEALVRWNDPSQGMVLPGSFIGLAEETGFIHALGEHVLLQACREVALWHGQGFDQVSVSINLSARQFSMENLDSLIRRVLAETGIDPNRVILEVTESTVMENLTSAERVLRSLRELGVRFALDDFGTGYASMAYLKRLPFSHLKIDRQFIRDLETNPSDLAITDAVVRMAGALGLTVVAEGVETAGQLRTLVSLKCDHAQGYYFARPMPPEECLRLLALAEEFA